MARVTALTQESTLREVSDRVFGTLNARDRARAEKALIEANPHLAQPNALVAGAVVRVPAVSGLKVRAAAGAQDPVSELDQAVAAAVVGYRERLSGHADAAVADLDAQTALLKDRTVAAELKRAGGTELGQQLAESLRARAKSLADARKRQEALFKRIDADLQKLDAG
jgi:hypothetical protein